MNRLVLSQICKNEEHCILSCLNSGVKDIYDMIVYVDTGSTDNTKSIILKWGEDNNIPAFVFDRPFDSFCNSRNYAMEMAKKMIDEKGWRREDTWTGWIDCDETLIVDKSFDKQKLNMDLYMINTTINGMIYTRNTFIRASKPGRFYGPVHEYIVCDEQNISSGLMEGLLVDVKMIGSSWQGDVSKKYLEHAYALEKYINYEDRNSRWVFYTAQSYHDSSNTPIKEDNEERLRRALKYYQERVNTLIGYEEERFYAQFRVATVKIALEKPWDEIHQDLMKSSAMDPLRAEPIYAIIQHYIQTAEWHLAYIYAKSAKSIYHGMNPYPNRLLFVDSSLYNWKLLDALVAAAAKTGRMDEAKENFNEILRLLKINPNWFSPEDTQKIQSNIKWFK